MPRKPKTVATPSTAAEAVVIDTAPVEGPVAAPPKKKAKAPAKPRGKKATAAVPVTIPSEPTIEQVAHEAYLLWLGEGMPAGKDMEHWLVAEQIVRSRLSLLAAAVHTA